MVYAVPLEIEKISLKSYINNDNDDDDNDDDNDINKLNASLKSHFETAKS